ncbi:CocE/NonD family hydrolase [Bauldia sp.]|uniref:CocE/NonD family hydrolase n=1 Tax=Bauldia sp. TaxID=2575872 RepID=UPI003BAD9A10
MTWFSRSGVASALLLAFSVSAVAECQRLDPAPAAGTERISEFGKYQGYSEARYDSFVRSSTYVEVSDGGKLATDVMIPAVDCVAADEPLPVVWIYTPYKRAHLNDDGSVRTAVTDHNAETLVRHGYIISATAIHGTAASFGGYRGFTPPSETQAAYDMIEWLAAQPWSDGNIGMIGGSYPGMVQFNVAALDPPPLKAIYPDVSAFDFHQTVHPGGIFRYMLWDYWSQLRHNMDLVVPSVPVDADTSGALLAIAERQHRRNWDPLSVFRRAKFRDYDQPDFSWDRNMIVTKIDALNRAAIPTYFSDGWKDVFIPDVLFWYANFTGPKRMTIGPWSHNSRKDPKPIVEQRWHLTAIEQHRWFDYWLKGIDNGIMDEVPINYTLITGPEMKHVWRTTASWPPPDIVEQPYFLGPDQRLTTDEPDDASAADVYVSDYTTTTGPNSRWNLFESGQQVYPDMAFNDAKSLTYTSGPLAADANVIGFPVVTLYVSSTANDGDFHILLEKVDDKGVSTYVTEGLLRASQRKRVPAPWKNYGLPYQSHKSTDVQTLIPDEIVELQFYLMPTSYKFRAGDRVRIAIMAADSANTENIVFADPPTMNVFRDQAHRSRIVLPIEQ